MFCVGKLFTIVSTQLSLIYNFMECLCHEYMLYSMTAERFLINQMKCKFYLKQVANELIEELNLRPEEVYLGQGTLRPDLIESASSLASSKADAIKTHHNDTDLVRELRKQVGQKFLC